MASRSSSPEPGYRSTTVSPTALMTTARPRPSLKSRQKHCMSFQGAAAGGWGVICWWVIYSSSLWGEGRLSKMLVCCPLIKAQVSEQAFPFSPRMCLLWPLHSQTRENGSSNYQLDWYVWFSGLRLSVLLWPVVSPRSAAPADGRYAWLSFTSVTWHPMLWFQRPRQRERARETR